MHFKLIVVITKTDLTESLIKAAKKAGATGATTIPARGTGVHEARTFFGLSLETQRDVILFVTEEHTVRNLLTVIREAGEFSQPGTGIAFTLDIEQIIGLESQIPKFKEEIRDKF